jgi:hypothetical protein
MRMRWQDAINSPCGVIMQLRFLDQRKYRELISAEIHSPENVIQNVWSAQPPDRLLAPFQE